MNTHSGMQLLLIVVLLGIGFAAVLGALLRRNRNPRAVPALVAVVAFLFFCIGAVLFVLMQTMANGGMVLFALLVLEGAAVCGWLCWFVLSSLRQLNKAAAALFFTYLAVVLFVTLLSRQGVHNTTVILELELWQALQAHDTDVLRHIAPNVALFAPLGALLPMMHRRLRSWVYALLCGAALSTMIETTQLLAAAGQCDVNDIIANTLGALLGYGLFRLLGMGRRME